MLPLKVNGLKWPEHHCLAPLCLLLNKPTCKFWKRSRGTLVPYCRWDGDRRGNHETWVSEHTLSQRQWRRPWPQQQRSQKDGVTLRCDSTGGPIPLSHLIKYDFFHLKFLVPSRFWVSTGWFIMAE